MTAATTHNRDATELLRDLVVSVEWLMETDPAAENYGMEQRRVRALLEEAKTFVKERDADETES